MFDQPQWKKCGRCGSLHVDYMGCKQCGDGFDAAGRSFVLSLVFVVGVLALVAWMAASHG